MGRFDQEGPQHEVVITRGFWLGETPVKQAQWGALKRANPSRFKGKDRPVEQVTWADCQEWLGRLSEAVPGLRARLPTEAEWEYACRAGTTGAYHDGSACTRLEGKDPVLEALGWYEKNSGGETHAVKGKRPNPWGLYDLHGNVWEWCRDAWDERAYGGRAAGVYDPEAKSADENAPRVVRGGAWGEPALYCRAAFRSDWEPDFRWNALGFRLAAGLEPGAAEPPGPEG